MVKPNRLKPAPEVERVATVDMAHATASRILTALQDLRGCGDRNQEEAARAAVLDLLEGVLDLEPLWPAVHDHLARAAAGAGLAIGTSAYESAHDGVRHLGVAAAAQIARMTCPSATPTEETIGAMVADAVRFRLLIQTGKAHPGAAALAWARLALGPADPEHLEQIHALLGQERARAAIYVYEAEFRNLDADQQQVVRQMAQRPGLRWSDADVLSDPFWMGAHKRRVLRALDALKAAGVVLHYPPRGGHALDEAHPMVAALRQGGTLLAP
ncbi:MAG: hypothetical protein IT458_19720 [Planctomycetes bacterium]|nr:hypothetical protein [Planctomycetota bacterium]